MHAAHACIPVADKWHHPNGEPKWTTHGWHMRVSAVCISASPGLRYGSSLDCWTRFDELSCSLIATPSSLIVAQSFDKAFTPD